MKARGLIIGAALLFVLTLATNLAWFVGYLQPVGVAISYGKYRGEGYREARQDSEQLSLVIEALARERSRDDVVATVAGALGERPCTRTGTADEVEIRPLTLVFRGERLVEIRDDVPLWEEVMRGNE